MSLSPDVPPPQADSLEFDKVEPLPSAVGETLAPASAGGSCAACHNLLVDRYWASADKTLCANCAEQAQRYGAARPGLKGFIKAGVAGSVVAFLGWGIYYLVSLTGYEFGLIAIAVGYLVGYAVRIGSGGHGGRAFQLLAMALTYCAIAGTHTPLVVASLLADDAASEDAPGDQADEAASDVPHENPEKPTPKAGLGHYIVGFVIALALPFMGGLQNIMGLVILAIGLWEAWKINRRLPLDLTGPFPIAPAANL